ncbi:HlyD family type I secretion periplasmic adaptor subunit [Azorhizobium oxalatiphilum]|uniref:Membrane fusion protein (MFP) family protein n=1 Tax=Azorhizobium oxalatiphilum TaxID=980631 RepID=A0A917FCX1_9HYPH|nr:HlyD family type I secretion periplasmic adaptor subunit [Azorhizobium oxalatiphilum]GGF69100.1 HlyD family type I secretion periplasmic adaptor subunit [Azorhizobium oxalatiphilum]
MLPHETSHPDLHAVRRSVRRHLMAGGLVAVLLVGGVGGWAAATTLAGAVVASGTAVVDSYVKKVQHPTGGVVGEIAVTEGQRVRAGEVVMRLDATQARASLAIQSKRVVEFTARRARLEAERDDLAQIVFPDWLLRADMPEATAAVHSERSLFAARRAARLGRQAQLRERIAQSRHEIEGLKAQEAAYDRGLVVLEKEIADLRPLLAKGIVNVQRLNSLETQAATFGGERGEKIAYQAQAAGRIAEAELQILQIDQDLRTEVGQELRDVDAQLGEAVERRVAAEDQLRRIDLIAPQDGVVHQLSVHTVGGVIAPGDIIMSVVPTADRLAVEARIRPQDIDQVQVGQSALLRLSAFNAHTTPELGGTVTQVAADQTEDSRTGQLYYLVRIALPASELQRMAGQPLLPGMPIEVFITTGARTALSYLVKPLYDQINRAFREE